MSLLYAIVGDMERARFMLRGKVPYLQLRFKEAPLAPHLDEIRAWQQNYPHTHLIVNDDLSLAEQAGAWGVHLGQEDLDRTDPRALRQTTLKVGISTHNDTEIERALAAGAHHLGFGPIFATGTKTLKHPPQGTDRLKEVVRQVKLPIVAIGGINDENLAGVAETGVAMIAMIAHLDGIQSTEMLAGLMKKMDSALAG